MNKILLFLYFVSVLVMMLGFYGLNLFTAVLEVDDTGGSNPAMIIPVFILPFFLLFSIRHYGTFHAACRKL